MLCLLSGGDTGHGHDRIPSYLVKPVKEIGRTIRLLRRSTINSVRAFRPFRSGYDLAIGQFGRFEVAYRAGTADEKVIGYSFNHDIFFAGVPEYNAQLDHVILDIGAHIGTFSLLAATMVPKGKVFAIEASKESYNFLKINIALNRLQNVEATHLALSDSKGHTRLYYAEGNWGHSIVGGMSSHGETVPTDTLAGYMASNTIDYCNFIKFNCEGAEFPILLSTPVEVLNRIERMLILYHCDLADQYSVDALSQHLRNSRFSLKFFNQTRHRGWIFAQRAGAGE